VGDVNRLVQSGRDLLRVNPGLGEAEFRKRLLDRAVAEDQGLKAEAAGQGGGVYAEGLGFFQLLLFPFFIGRWMQYRRRLAQYRADVNESVRVLRQEGHFASGPA
jgi:hypothetical protein